MKRTALFLATAATLGLSTVATSALAGGLVALGGLPPPANAWAWGNGPAYFGEYAPSAYDSYVFAYQYPIYTGRQVTAIAVDLSSSRFRHRRVAGPGVAWYGSHYPRVSRVHRYW
jgi:hypothetical protein